jgi:DNA-binding MarR family transcriptional regulator
MKIDELMTAIDPATKISFPLTVRHLRALLFLTLHDDAIDYGLARDQLGYHGPVLSRSMDALGILGFAKRQRREDDKRKVLVMATDKGREFVAKLCNGAP